MKLANDILFSVGESWVTYPYANDSGTMSIYLTLGSKDPREVTVTHDDMQGEQQYLSQLAAPRFSHCFSFHMPLGSSLERQDVKPVWQTDAFKPCTSWYVKAVATVI